MSCPQPLSTLNFPAPACALPPAQQIVRAPCVVQEVQPCGAIAGAGNQAGYVPASAVAAGAAAGAGAGAAAAHHGWGGQSLVNLIFWFILIAIIVGILLYLFKPAFVQSVDPVTGLPNGGINWGPLILWSLLISLVIVIIIYIIRMVGRSV